MPRQIVMNRARRGLYEGVHIHFGNTVSEYKNKERRTWKPNVQHKNLKSEVLGETHRIKLTTKALKTVKKKGGLDEYLVSSKHVGDSIVGTVLRARIMEKLGDNPHIPRPEPIERKYNPPKSWLRVSTNGIYGTY